MYEPISHSATHPQVVLCTTVPSRNSAKGGMRYRPRVQRRHLAVSAHSQTASGCLCASVATDAGSLPMLNLAHPDLRLMSTRPFLKGLPLDSRLLSHAMNDKRELTDCCYGLMNWPRVVFLTFSLINCSTFVLTFMPFCLQKFLKAANTSSSIVIETFTFVKSASTPSQRTYLSIFV